jgi:hypothetical protein
LRKDLKGGSGVVGSVDAQGREKKAFHLLSWIPLICARIMNDEASRDEVDDFISRARPELHRHLKAFLDNSRSMSESFLTCEERKAVDLAESLRDKELLGYHMSLRCIEKYLKNRKKSCIINARRHFETSELSWKRLLRQMMHFAIINLSGRRFSNIL